MGNNPVTGVDPDGGWNWITAGIGFAAFGGVAALSGDKDWWKWGLAGGLVGGAMFTKRPNLQSAGWGTKGRQLGKDKLVLSSFGAGLINTAERLFVPLGNRVLDEVLVEHKHKSRNAPNLSSDKLKLSAPQSIKPFNPEGFKKQGGEGPPPCPDLNGVSFIDDSDWDHPRITKGSAPTLARAANYLRSGGRIRITNVNSKYTGLTTTRYSHRADDIWRERGAEILVPRVNLLVRTLRRMGAPINNINTTTAYFNGGGSVKNGNIGIECQ